MPLIPHVPFVSEIQIPVPVPLQPLHHSLHRSQVSRKSAQLLSPVQSHIHHHTEPVALLHQPEQPAKKWITCQAPGSHGRHIRPIPSPGGPYPHPVEAALAKIPKILLDELPGGSQGTVIAAAQKESRAPVQGEAGPIYPQNRAAPRWVCAGSPQGGQCQAQDHHQPPQPVGGPACHAHLILRCRGGADPIGNRHRSSPTCGCIPSW